MQAKAGSALREEFLKFVVGLGLPGIMVPKRLDYVLRGKMPSGYFMVLLYEFGLIRGLLTPPPATGSPAPPARRPRR